MNGPPPRGAGGSGAHAARRRVVRERLAARGRPRGRSRESRSSRRHPPTSRPLARGEVDAGLVPRSSCCASGISSPSAAAGSRRSVPVDSVLLMLRRAPHAVRTLALDPASRTSQVLATLVLEQVFGARPACFEADSGRAWAEGRADAVLVIGDARSGCAPRGAPALDLADEWTRWTGLPFVFAVWAARPGSHATRARLESRSRPRAGAGRDHRRAGAAGRDAWAARRGGLPGLPHAEDSLRSRRVGDARPQAVPGAG